MPAKRRIVAAIVCGLLATAACYAFGRYRGVLANDFTWPLRAARALQAGQNPYAVVTPVGAFPFSDWFYYPLPAALVAWPFRLLGDYYLAGALFFGLSGGLLACALAADGWRRFPLFLSVPFYFALMMCQWSPLLVAAAILPVGFRALAICKPNLGVVAFAYRPSWQALAVVAAAGLLSVVAFPWWPWAWYQTVAAHAHHTPQVLFFPGFVLLLAALRWRKPEGRLLLVLALVPQQQNWYDVLPLWLIPASGKASLRMACWSWVVYGLFLATHVQTGLFSDAAIMAPWILAGAYLPALAILYAPELHSVLHRSRPLADTTL